MNFDIPAITRTIFAIVDANESATRPRNLMVSSLASKVAEEMGGTWTTPRKTRLIKQVVISLVCVGKLSATAASSTGRWVKRGDAQQTQQQDAQQTTGDAEHRREVAAIVARLEAEASTAKQKAEQLAKQLQAKTTTVEEVHTYKTPKGKPKVMKATFHAQFKVLLDLAKLRENIFLYGPTGCGKSYICSQLAEALGLPFAFVSCSAGMSEGQIGGKLLPTGKGGQFEYVLSEFVRCYEQGGVFLLDEIDAADDNVLLFVNAALASDRCAVPNRPDNPYATKHPDFICVAAANTAGTGADRMYSGRKKLDGATLDRFQIGKVYLDYDLTVEQMLCPDEQLLAWCHAVRRGINENRLERAMSSRFIEKAYKMHTQAGWTLEQIADRFYCGWREDEINKVKQYTS